MQFQTLFESINVLAVVAAALVHMITGLVWFSGKLFGKQWVELTKQELKPARQWLLAGLVGHLLLALVLAVVVHLTHATSLIEGMLVGILMWIGFIVPLEIGELIWEKIPFRLFTIRIGNHIVAMSLAGGVLSVWQ